MFTVVITEKGGSQKRLSFGEPEVTIGRVPGNDVVLPKGNVSKRHSRIVLKDNRFIVVDLKSTNGTYVNGRKITSPLVVKEGDKIYIGDFILTLEGDPAIQAPSDAMKQPSILPSLLDGEGAASIPASMPPPLPSRAPDPHDSIPAVLRASLSPPTSPSSQTPPPHTAVGMPAVKVPGEDDEGERSPKETAHDASSVPYAADEVTGSGDDVARPLILTPAVPANGRAAPIFVTASSSLPPEQRDDLRSLMLRLGREFDVDNPDASGLQDEKRWQRAERAIQGKLSELANDGTLSRNVDRVALANAALHEAVGLGPLDGLLDQTDVSHVVVERFDRLRVDRGDGLASDPAGFSSPYALMTVVRRLLSQGGIDTPQLTSCDLALPNGVHVVAVLPNAASEGPVVSIRRRPTKVSTLEMLESDGLLTSADHKAIRDSLVESKHVWVVAPSGTDAAPLMSAMLEACPKEQRVALFERAPDIALASRAAVCFKLGAVSLSELIERVRYFRPDRLVLHELREADLPAALAAFAHRNDGSLASLECSTSRHALSALDKADCAGLATKAVDVLVELARSGAKTRVSSVHRVEADGSGKLAFKPTASA